MEGDTGIRGQMEDPVEFNDLKTGLIDTAHQEIQFFQQRVLRPEEIGFGLASGGQHLPDDPQLIVQLGDLTHILIDGLVIPHQIIVGLGDLVIQDCRPVAGRLRVGDLSPLLPVGPPELAVPERLIHRELGQPLREIIFLLAGTAVIGIKIKLGEERGQVGPQLLFIGAYRPLGDHEGKVPFPGQFLVFLQTKIAAGGYDQKSRKCVYFAIKQSQGGANCFR